MSDSAVAIAVTDTSVQPIPDIPSRWSLPTRLAFRFLFIYFGAYILTTQMLGGLAVLPGLEFPPLENLPPIRTLYFWTARHVFHISRPLVVISGSGDKIFNWVGAFCLVVIAGLGAAIWSALDRRRLQYRALNKWFRVFLRFGLGTTMLSYGMAKVIPLQMPFPSLLKLLERYGDFSPMGVLWSAIGAAPGYERFAGGMELAAAVLLFIPGLSTLGACVAFADAVQILTLNLTYDVPVKLFAFHLVLLSLILLAPEFTRILNVLVLNRPAAPSSQPRLVTGRMAGRIVGIAQVALGVYLIAMSYVGARQFSAQMGAAAAKPPLYGIWNVDTLTIDGVEHPALLSDPDRWHRVIVPRTQLLAIQAMDDTFKYYVSATDPAHKLISLKGGGDKSASSQFTYEQPDPSHLRLDGELSGRHITAELSFFDTTHLQLLKSGFHWVQEYPLNR